MNAAQVSAAVPIVCVRKILVAEGWKMVTGDDDDSSSDEED